jgi:hypothetical protein
MNTLAMIFALAARLVIQDSPPLQEIVDRIGSNVQELQNTLPDITCKEKLTLRSGNLSYSHEALMTTSRLAGRGRVYFRVSRQVISSKGPNPGVINEIQNSGVINRIQNLLADLTLAFGPENRAGTNYKFVRRQNFRGVSAYVIEFETRKGASSSNRGGTLTGGGDPLQRMNGKGWVDPNSMQVLRIEVSEQISGRRFEDTALDYGAVNIDGKVYWLLTKLSKKAAGNGEIAVEYSECRKFEVKSQIRPVQ